MNRSVANHKYLNI